MCEVTCGHNLKKGQLKVNYKLKFSSLERRLGYVSLETRDWLVLARENSLATNQK